ncbi:MAG: putative glutamine amidotransferase [Chloroflexota bacterium]|jgi:putative glutamine amidotransferase|nr:putative glutamine amidotransferase [Chloroflexota bacterium]
MRPVVVGITLRPVTREGHPERLLVNRVYSDALERAGAVPLTIPTLRDPAAAVTLLEACDGLLLPGGPDVEPRRYGEEPCEGCRTEWVADLDATEAAVLERALEADLPVLAICRGCQLLNVVRGGSLWQDIAVQGAGDAGHDGETTGTPRTQVVHPVVLEPDSLLAAVLQATVVGVNSLHHQALRRVGEGLRVVGRSPDGLAEAVEMPGRRFVVGLQCHPEEHSATEPWAARLFTALVEAAHRRREGPSSLSGSAVGE